MACSSVYAAETQLQGLAGRDARAAADLQLHPLTQALGNVTLQRVARVGT